MSNLVFGCHVKIKWEIGSETLNYIIIAVRKIELCMSELAKIN